MLYNELNLIKKLMDGPQSKVITLHQYSKGAGIPTNPKFAKTTACRLIKVIRDEHGRLAFQYERHPAVLDSFMDAYSLFYKNCPSDTKGTPHYYFGDIFLGVNIKSSNDLLNRIIPFYFEEKFPLVTEFNQLIRDEFLNFWSYVEQMFDQINKNPMADGMKDLKKYTGMFIHFDFSDVAESEHWYNLKSIIEFLDYLELEGLKRNTKGKAAFDYIPEVSGYSLNKGFFHTVTSGDEKSDNQFPGFDLTQKYKSFSLAEDQLRSIFYYSKTLKRCQIGIPDSAPYCFRLIPVGSYSTQSAVDYIDHIKELRRGVPEDQLNKLEKLEDQVVSEDEEPEELGSSWDPTELIAQAAEKCAKEMISFDLILLRLGTKGPDVNVGEINNMSRSSLRKNLSVIKEKVNQIKDKRKARTSVTRAFFNVHYKGKRKGEDKYQVKFARMMLKLYRGLYFGDPELDKIFLDRVHKDIRETGMKNYYGLKTSYSLLKLLSNKGDEMTKSQELSKSLGRHLAQIMWPLSFVIGRRSRSFEKAQVGQIRYRVGTLPQVVRLLGEYRGRISLHANESLGKDTERVVDVGRAGRALHDANSTIETLEKENCKYDRDQLVLGFFDEYDLQCYLASKPK
jgi:hypothetical protein